MSDDLVKRLRDLGDHASFEPHMHHTAADRIEELEAKLAACEKCRDAYAGCDRIGTQAVRDLEAKLAKAVEECACIAESHKPSAALLSDRYWRGVDEAAHSIAYEIYATLADLTGGEKNGD